MKRSEAKRVLENIEFLKAFAEGKRVETEWQGSWSCNEDLVFTDKPERYRVVEPKIRPYNAKEAEKLVGFAVRHKEGGVFLIDAAINDSVSITGKMYTLWSFMENFTRINGEPCGVVE
jgi:hypothetical protein